MTKRTVVLAVALVTGVPGCVDLNEDVVTGLTPGAYGSEAVFQALVNASYEPLRSFWGQERGFTLTVFGTDIYTKGADGSYKFVNDYTSNLNPTVDTSRTPGTISIGRSTRSTRPSTRRRSYRWTRASR